MPGDCAGGQWAELLEDGNTRRRLGEDHVFVGKCNIVKLSFRPVEEKQESSGPRAKPVSRVEKKIAPEEGGAVVP